MKQLSPSPTLGLLAWHPREVLELERWEEPDESYLDRPPSGPTGHLKRLFACIVLLRNVAFVSSDDWDGEREFFIATSAATVIQLVRSCFALGHPVLRLAPGFLLWLHATQDHPVLRPFVSFAVLLLQIQEGPGNILEICAWVEENERLAREHLGDDVHSAKWLIGLNYQEDSYERPQCWTDTLAQLIVAKSALLPTEIALVLRQMHNRMSQ